MKDNLPIVTVEEFSQIIKQQLNENNYRPIFGLGKGGIGKTESIAHLAKEELKIGYIDMRLLLYTETDLKGIPYPNEEHTKTIWLQNNILPNASIHGEKGILVLDEITSCSRSVRTAAYQLLNERRLGEYILPDNWLIVCLGNGEEDGGDYEGMEGNFANRCSVFKVVHNVETWKSWAYNNNVNPLVIGYISFKSSDLHSYNNDNETDILFASPRSWKAVSDILNSNPYDANNRLLLARIAGNIGPAVADQFNAFCKYKNNDIDTDAILNGTKFPVIESNEIAIITIQNLINIVGNEIKADLSIGNEISSNTVTRFCNVIKWMVGLKTEFAVMGIKDLIAFDRVNIAKLLMNAQIHQICPELLQFTKTNKGIFM